MELQPSSDNPGPTRFYVANLSIDTNIALTWKHSQLNVGHMEQALKLRAKAAHCISLSLGIGNPQDVAAFEAHAAELRRAAAEIENAEATRLAVLQTPEA